MTKIQMLYMAATFVVSFIFSFASVPVARWTAYKIGAIDVPKDERRVHKTPIPLLGGLAIFFGFLVGVLSFGTVDRQLIATLAGAVIIVVLGVIDDTKPLSAKLKFVVQLVAAFIVVYFGDIKISVFTNPNVFSNEQYLVLNDYLAIPATILWIVTITNAVNLIDGLDGLAAGVSSITSVTLVFISLSLGQYAIAITAIAVAGACLGFLPFNFNPAKMFMGDTGATFLGFILAILSIQGVFKSYAVITFAVPILMFGLPVFDTSFAVLRRLLTGKNIMSPDRGHLHHRLLDFGFSQKQTVFILYAISGVLGITAVILAESGVLRALLLVIGVLIALCIGSILMKNDKKSSAETEKTANNTENNDKQ